VAIITRTIKTPVGEMIAGATDQGICLLDFKYRKSIPIIQRRIREGLQDNFEDGQHPLLDNLVEELNQYFTGELKEFTVPLLPVGSAFQVTIWANLQKIPYGSVVSYLDQSRTYGDEKAIRAVATANGMNGIAIIIPCHRVISSNGSLTGYGGGLPAKRWLLDHEKKHTGGETQASLF
jgi:O-6-methylguanine DNA methyltransferase